MSNSELPELWSEGTFSSIADVNPSVSVAGLERNAPVSFLAMADVGENGRIINHHQRPLDEVRSGFTRFQNDDVLFAKITPCMENGKGAFATELENGVGFGSTEFHVLRANDDGYPEFVFHLSQNSETRDRAIAFFSGSAGQQRVATDFFFKHPVLLPPKPEQKKIARILTTLDNLIEKTEALIAKYQAIKQGMMHDLFTRGVDEHGQLRPTQQQAPELYKQSELGWIPKDSNAVPLSKIAAFQVGYAFKSKWFSRDSGVRLLRGENVGYGHPDWKDTQRLPQKHLRAYGEYVLSPGDIVIGMDRTFTKSGVKITVMQETDCPALLVQRVGRFKAIDCDHNFLRTLLFFDGYHFELKKQEKGMDIPHLSQSEILSPLVVVPPPDEQTKVADRCLALEKVLAREEALLEKTQMQKHGLMQDLLTGKVRVKGDEAEEVAAHA